MFGHLLAFGALFSVCDNYSLSMYRVVARRWYGQWRSL